MQIILFLIMFIMALCGIPTIWFMVELFLESGLKEFEPIITFVRNAIHSINLNHDDPNVNKLFWDYKTNTMYGHPVMVA